MILRGGGLGFVVDPFRPIVLIPLFLFQHIENDWVFNPRDACNNHNELYALGPLPVTFN